MKPRIVKKPKPLSAFREKLAQRAHQELLKEYRDLPLEFVRKIALKHPNTNLAGLKQAVELAGMVEFTQRHKGGGNIPDGNK